MQNKIIFIALLGLLFVGLMFSGCVKKQEQQQNQQQTQQNQQQNQQTIVNEEDLNSLDQELSDLETIEDAMEDINVEGFE